MQQRSAPDVVDLVGVEAGRAAAASSEVGDVLAVPEQVNALEVGHRAQHAAEDDQPGAVDLAQRFWLAAEDGVEEVRPVERRQQGGAESIDDRDHAGVEVPARAAAYVGDRVADPAVGARQHQLLGHVQHPGDQSDLLTGPAERDAVAVPALVDVVEGADRRL